MSILSIKHASPITLLKRLFHDLLLPYVQKKKPFVFITNHFSLYVSYYLTNWRLIKKHISNTNTLLENRLVLVGLYIET